MSIIAGRASCDHVTLRVLKVILVMRRNHRFRLGTLSHREVWGLLYRKDAPNMLTFPISPFTSTFPLSITPKIQIFGLLFLCAVYCFSKWMHIGITSRIFKTDNLDPPSRDSNLLICA